MMARARVRAGLPAIGLLVAVSALEAQQPQERDDARLQWRLESRLAEMQASSGAPGATAGVVLPDGTVFALAAGISDTMQDVAMTASSRLLQGSVGKTYVAAVAMQLVHEGLLDLDARVSHYLGDEPWYTRLPNHADITVRQLMNHTSGIIRYEFNEQFLVDMLADPDRVWRPEEQLAYLFDTEAPFPAGEGWDYSDTNYIILGMIIERLTGHTYYDEMQRRVLDPLALENTVPSNSRRIPGLVQGYAGVGNPLGVPDQVIVDGEFVINPQFEWTGGGIASTSEDLARWAMALYEGRAFDPSMLPVMLDAVPARLGPGAEYGLGVIVRTTPLGTSWGHSGYFPGYLTEMAYFPDYRIAVAVQINSSDFPRLQMSPGRMLLQLAQLVAEETGQVDPQ